MRSRAGANEEIDAAETKRDRQKGGRSTVGPMANELKVEIESDPNKFPIEEFEPAPIVYIDGMQGMTLTGGVAKINCFSIYADKDGKTMRRVVLRLAVPVHLIAGMQMAFGQILDQLKTAGLVAETPQNAKH